MKSPKEIQKQLFEQFGMNAGFVNEIFDNYLKDKNSVSEYWLNFFDNIDKNLKPKKTYPKTKEDQISKIPSNDIGNLANEIPTLVTGVGAKIIENMELSLSIPTATSLRAISVKLLEENRRIINYHLLRLSEKKISYSHIVAYSIVKALKKYPSLNNSYNQIESRPYILEKKYINLGIAVDMIKRDGSRTLIVPNIKKASEMNFSQFRNAYDDIVFRARNGKIEPADFQETTISLTNPGGIGTVSSSPRLMIGQGCILAVGAIDYPAEFKAMQPSALAQLGIGKVMTITNTYDHRIIQGAASGQFLQEIDNLLRGNDNFYEDIFEDLRIPQRPVGWNVDTTTRSFGNGHDIEFIEKQAKIPLLVNIFRVRGHLIANVNPLSFRTDYYSELDPAEYGFTIWDYDREFISNIVGLERASLRKIMNALRQTYCEMVGAEFMHIQRPDEKKWLMTKMESVRNIPNFSVEQKKRILEKLIIAEGFEHFLHTRYIGHKRFSLEGSETLIPALDHLLGIASLDGTEEVVIGMAHRGRLNVLANIIGKKYENIFSEFEDDNPDRPQGTGDVKYHLGATGIYKTFNNNNIKVTVASNPSHLEFVDPVVEGIVRAKQERNNDENKSKTIPVLIHGDAAFAGQGVVAETLNLSQLKGYRTGGTIHIIVNNQIGFTTSPEDARSSPYATDVAKMVQAPIFHVNGDNPEAAIWITQLAFEYRQKFNKDVVIDLFGYRRHGHNEGDDPAYTQPLMYKKIKSHPSVKMIYSDKIIAEKIVGEEDVKVMDKEVYSILEIALKKSKNIKDVFMPDRPLAYSKEVLKRVKPIKETKINDQLFEEIIKGITTFPEEFAINPKLKRIMLSRKDVLDGKKGIDWAFGESLAFGSLLLEDIAVRLSGQDSARGTFSQRHLILTDMNDGSEILPLNKIRNDQEKIEALDSLLSENAVLGFEYGYSAADPLSLVIWEAQFGDFANGAQVIIDNFISSSEIKWNVPNNIVMLLPHAQEGQGPEHSSARLERFLILCAKNNMVIANPTTPAQYFHLLRRHVKTKMDKPMVVFTPKSLLRLPAAQSVMNDFVQGEFKEILDEENIDKKTIRKILLTSGKVYYDLLKFKQDKKITDVAVVRIEQYYPLNKQLIINILKSYINVKEVSWVQEEPQNMGAWYFMLINLFNDLPKKYKVNYIGREESPSPASGSSKEFQVNQEKLIRRAFE